MDLAFAMVVCFSSPCFGDGSNANCSQDVSYGEAFSSSGQALNAMRTHASRHARHLRKAMHNVGWRFGVGHRRRCSIASCRKRQARRWAAKCSGLKEARRDPCQSCFDCLEGLIRATIDTQSDFGVRSPLRDETFRRANPRRVCPIHPPSHQIAVCKPRCGGPPHQPRGRRPVSSCRHMRPTSSSQRGEAKPEAVPGTRHAK